jgi:hypothetical protein
MTEKTEGWQRKLRRLWLALAALALILAVLLVPPLVSVSRYKSRITQLMSASLGRPVHLSSVSVRVLPRPSFVLTDLTVEEDPAYGAEPILHANTVTASIRLLSLWRGRLEIGTVSVDEASLNLVRTAAGRWNLDPLFRTVAANAQPGTGAAAPRGPRKLPFLEATNSRINIKNGTEKLPFSLLNTDISFSHENSGEWRLRLRGQPARTDLSLDMADTGVVRLNANGRQAPELRQMPVHLDLEWREAQLGQLTKLLIGTDPGWRGNLTGELHLDGTADAAQVKTRLRAEQVHRAEFAPAAPLDFDANCGFIYHYTSRALENLACDSPLGSGRIHLAGDLPGEGAAPHLSVELAQIPAQAGLDALRTVRSGFGPGLEAKGTVSGKITYAENAAPDKAATQGKNHPVKARPAAMEPLTGSLAVEGFQLAGGGLTTPIRLPRLLLEPVAPAQGQPQPRALTATLVILAGGAGPLTVNARIALSGYQMTIRGQVAIARARELAHAGGMRNASVLDSLAGEPLTVDLNAEGPWLQTQVTARGAGTASAGEAPIARRMSGTIVLHNANWKAAYLVNHVEISQATLHLGQGEIRWDPVDFSFGPVKGIASLALPEDCDAPQPCVPHFEIQFGELDAVALQAALLGAHEPGTLLSTLIARLRPASAPAWPRAEGTVKAQSLILAPVRLENATATLRTSASGAEITSLDAGLLGGRLHLAGTLETGDKPAYTLTGDLSKLSPAAVGQLLGLRSTGTAFDANGKIALSGFTGKDLAASVKGAMHFDWRRGSIASGPGSVPSPLARFDHWTGDAEIANGAVTVKQSEAQQGARKYAVEATVTLATSPRMTFAKEPPAKR